MAAILSLDANPQVSVRRATGVKRTTFRGIQVLRGFAASIVVVHHATLDWSLAHPGAKIPYWSNGAAGVDVFFVISGFIMAVTTAGTEREPGAARNFLDRRLIRVVPLYWIMTAITLVKLIWMQIHPMPGPPVLQTPLSYVIASFLFIPYRNSLGNVDPLLIAGWTLSFEMFFYLLLTGALALHKGVVRILTPLMIALALVGFFSTKSWPAITVLASPLLLEFLAGLLLGFAIVRGVRFNTALVAVLGVLSIPALIFVPQLGQRALTWGIPAYLLVQAAAALEPHLGRFWPQWALLIGDASYSLYLSHALVLGVLFRVLWRAHGGITNTILGSSEILCVVVCLLVSIAAAIVLFLTVEKPITKALRRRFAL